MQPDVVFPHFFLPHQVIMYLGLEFCLKGKVAGIKLDWNFGTEKYIFLQSRGEGAFLPNLNVLLSLWALEPHFAQHSAFAFSLWQQFQHRSNFRTLGTTGHFGSVFLYPQSSGHEKEVESQLLQRPVSGQAPSNCFSWATSVLLQDCPVRTVPPSLLQHGGTYSLETAGISGQ